MQNDLNSSSALQLSDPLNLIMRHPTQNINNYELDLFQLFSEIYEKRWLIIVFTALSTIIATIIAFVIPPQYRVQITLSAPNNAQIQKLYLNTDSQLSNNQLFHKFARKLSYEGNIIFFLQDSGVINEALNGAKQAISPRVKISTQNSLAKQYQITLIHHDTQNEKDKYKDNSEEAVLTTYSSALDLDSKNAKAYLDYTNQQFLANIIKEQRAITDKNIKALKKQIRLDSAKEALSRTLQIKRLENEQSLKLAEIYAQIEALNQRDFRDRQLHLQELNNALKVATALGITSPYTLQQVDNHSVVIDVNSDRDDLYMRGTTYLKNEIAIVKKRPHTLDYDKKLSLLQEKIDIIKNDQTILALKNRLDDKPYIKDIEKKQIELNRLKSLSFDVSNVTAYNTDSMPLVETSPIKPKKRLIILIGFIFGVFLACFIVFVKVFIQTRKAYELALNNK